MPMKKHKLMKQIPRITGVKKNAVLPGKENIVVKGKEHSGKRGVKRTSTECDLCSAKRQKTTVQIHTDVVCTKQQFK